MRTLSVSIVFLLAGATAGAETLTGADVVEGLDISDAEKRRLEAGEVLAMDGEPWENSARELAADAAVLVNRPLAEILEEVQEVPTIIPQKYLIEYHDIESADDFAAVAFAADEYEHADEFLKTKVGKDFNLSNEEVKALNAANASAKSREARLQAASDALRNILVARYEAYQQQGLDGVAPYQRSKKKAVSIGRDLKLTTEALQPISEYFSDYYQVMHDYPDGADCCEHIFRWLKVEIRKKPVFALSHTIIQRRDTSLLITERHFYVSSTLNSVQVTVSWVPWDHDTQMGLAVSASTDILDSLLGKVLRPLGRNKARDLVTDVMTEMRDDLHGVSNDD